MRCQMKVLREAVEPLSPREMIRLQAGKARRQWAGRFLRTLGHPGRLLRSRRQGSRTGTSVSAPPRTLGLVPGERVRVRSYEEILATLDEEGRTDGLGFMTSAMRKYCGGIYTVRKRIRLFFDERRREMLKARNVVILDGVYCESPPDDTEDWAGCDRTCFLFWKEAWLERVPDEPRTIS